MKTKRLDLRGLLSTKAALEEIKKNIKLSYQLEILTDDPYLMVRLKRQGKNVGCKISKVVEDRPVKTVNKWHIFVQEV